MDIKSMYQKGMSRRPKRRVKHKVYCIIINQGMVYFPIAASRSPYGERGESYLAGMFNFFGGNKNRYEDDSTALRREIEEESQGKISVGEIPPEALTPLFSEGEGTDQDTYQFYLANIDSFNVDNLAWENGTVFRLNLFEECPEDAKRHPERYEDSFLVRMEAGRFCELLGEVLQAKDIADADAREAQVESSLTNQGIAWTGSKQSVDNWYGSHTATAFANYCQRQ